MGEDQIVFFGTQHQKKAFVLQQKEEGDELEIKKEMDLPFDYQINYDKDCSCRAVGDELFVFPTNQYAQVYRFDLKEWAKHSG